MYILSLHSYNFFINVCFFTLNIGIKLVIFFKQIYQLCFLSPLSIKTSKPFSVFFLKFITILVNRNYTHVSIIHLDYFILISGLPFMDMYTFVSQIILWRLSKKDFNDFTALLKKVLKTKFFHCIFVQVMNKSKELELFIIHILLELRIIKNY